MKIPSITKLPKYKQFQYTPRYYDPVKEAIDQKIRDAQAELAAEKGEIETDEGYSRRIRDSFRRRSRIEKQKTDFSQSFFVLCFSSFFILYYYYGNEAFWMLAVMLPLYLWMKLRKK